MIEQKTPLGDGIMTVTFQWDSGDPSVGINSGWGEETGVEVRLGPFVTYVLFDVEVDKPVKDWRIDEIQCAYEREEIPYIERTDSPRPLREALGEETTSTVYWKPTRSLTMMADELNVDRVRSRTLESLPVVCKAVERAWDQVQAIEALESVGERIWEAEENVHDLQERLTAVLSFDWDLLRELERAQVALEAATRDRDWLRFEYNEKYGTAQSERR